MQRARKAQSWTTVLVALVILLLSAGFTVVAASSQVPAVPVPQATRTPTPAPKSGRITAATANVRGQPGTNATVIGKLRKGDRVTITQQRPGWVEIVYPPNTNQRGWISASLVSLGGQSATATKPGGIPAPVIVDYQRPNVLWKWDGENAVKGRDWYFDILLMQGGANQPYDTAQANPSDAVKRNGVWTFSQPKAILCETTMMMAIAERKDGRWIGWISPLSNGIKVGPPCECDDPCPGCGDGGCAD